MDNNESKYPQKRIKNKLLKIWLAADIHTLGMDLIRQLNSSPRHPYFLFEVGEIFSRLFCVGHILDLFFFNIFLLCNIHRSLFLMYIVQHLEIRRTRLIPSAAAFTNLQNNKINPLRTRENWSYLVLCQYFNNIIFGKIFIHWFSYINIVFIHQNNIIIFRQRKVQNFFCWKWQVSTVLLKPPQPSVEIRYVRR